MELEEMVIFNQKLTIQPSRVSSTHSDYTFSFYLNKDLFEDEYWSMYAQINFTDFLK